MASIDEEAKRLRKQIVAGEHEAARWTVQKLLRRHPRHPGLLIDAALIEQRGGEFAASIERLRRGVRESPADADLREALGLSLDAANDRAAAEHELRETLRLDPNRVLALEKIIRYLIDRDEWDECESLLLRLTSLDPNHSAGWNWLGWLKIAMGLMDEAQFAFDRALALDPKQVIPPSNRVLAQSQVCVLSNYDPSKSAEDVLAIHRKWDEQFGTPAIPRTPKILPHKNDRTADRPLRVGYVSPDFRMHPVSHFIDPLLSNHDRSQVQTFCYSNSSRVDRATARLRSLTANWREITDKTDDEVESLLHADQIDILVDLTGHFAQNRLPLFARKPAPVQVSMIGYPGTTGLSAIDYKISDPHCDPVGAEKFFSEKLARLADVLWCFSPLEDSPPPDDLPAHRAGKITFGSINMFIKISDEALDCWAQIVAQTPDSTVHFQQSAFRSDRPRQRVYTAFRRHGIADDRITFAGLSDQPQYIKTIRSFDIGLDPFPFNGGTTTCNLLHHGVPIVALAGVRQTSRMGASMLRAVGLSDLIADSKSQYIQKTVDLARDVDRLADIRASLRSRMLDSKLCDGRAYAKQVELAYRRMWMEWCQRGDAK